MNLFVHLSTIADFVTELPYQVNKRQLIRNIADQVREKRLEGISDLRDETDRNGMRIVIELKRDANPQVVLNRLLAQTQLQSSFSINMLALVNNQTQPKILSLRHILDEYLTFQEDVIVRRTRYDLRKAEERAHLLEGLLIAQDNIDEVIHIIRNSYDDAKQNLMARFGLDRNIPKMQSDLRRYGIEWVDSVRFLCTVETAKQCFPDQERYALHLDDIIRDIIVPAGKPVLANMSIGHMDTKITVPLGVQVNVDADAGTLEFVEAALKD